MSSLLATVFLNFYSRDVVGRESLLLRWSGGCALSPIVAVIDGGNALIYFVGYSWTHVDREDFSHSVDLVACGWLM